MTRQLLLFLLGLAFLAGACAPSGPSAKGPALLGNWSTVKNYDATEIVFSVESDGTKQFNSFLRGRPYESGTWQVKGGDISVFANGNNTYTFKDFKVENNKLTFTENGKQAIFNKIIETDEALETFKALLPKFNKFLNVTFPPPVKTTFPWLVSSSGDGLVQVNGYETTARVTVNGDFTHVNQAVSVLKDNGFSVDQLNVTEIVDGFRKGSLVGLVLLGSDEENNDVCDVTIRLGSLDK
ncbi:MAG: hypothetical protein PHH14_05870 [Candidatus Margulisbacteria bacterium]|nr:hypothetical protein [Candidatus Margulisiibacteriota bacterium]